VTTVVPNGVDTAFWHRSTPSLGTDTIAFTGVMSYHPNDDAALRLVTEVMPRVWRSEPEVRCLVIGRDPTPALRAAAARDARVELTGFVDDVRPHLERASGFVAPLRFGAGIQNKLLEALAMELPVIASSLATAGLVVEGAAPPVIVADEPATVAEQIGTLLAAVRADPRPRRDARTFVERAFSWEHSGQLLEDVLRSL
jgi:glycosyltransferase involved in cell wall biosynthesis